MHLLIRTEQLEEAIAVWWDRTIHNIEIDKQEALEALKSEIVSKAAKLAHL